MPVPSGTMSGIAAAIAADATASTASTAETTSATTFETPAPVEAPEAAAAAPAGATAQPEAVSAPAIPGQNERFNAIRAQAVPLSTHKTALRERHQAMAGLEAATARIAVLEDAVKQALAAQRPDAAAMATETAETEEQWLQKLLDAGAEIPPALVEGIQSTLRKVEALEKMVGAHGQHFASVQEARANSDYDQGFARLSARCAGMDHDTLEDMLAKGIEPRHIVQFYESLVVAGGRSPAAPAAATARGASGHRSSAPPQIAGTAAPTISAALPDNYGVKDLMSWARGELSRH